MRGNAGRLVVGFLVLIANQAHTPAANAFDHADPIALDPLLTIIERAKPEAARAARTAAEIVAGLSLEDAMTFDLTRYDLQRLSERGFALSRTAALSVPIRTHALEIAVGLATLAAIDARELPLKALLSDPLPAIRRAALELAPNDWVTREAALVQGLVIVDADATVAATAGQVICALKKNELQVGMVTRLSALLADDTVPLEARLGSALCVAEDRSPEAQKALQTFLKKVPSGLAKTFKKKVATRP